MQTQSRTLVRVGFTSITDSLHVRSQYSATGGAEFKDYTLQPMLTDSVAGQGKLIHHRRGSVWGQNKRVQGTQETAHLTHHSRLIWLFR